MTQSWCRNSDAAPWVGFMSRHDFCVITAALPSGLKSVTIEFFSVATELARWYHDTVSWCHDKVG